MRQLLISSVVGLWLLPLLVSAQTATFTIPTVTPNFSPTPTPVSLEDQIFAPALPMVHWLGTAFNATVNAFRPSTMHPLWCRTVSYLPTIPYLPHLIDCHNVPAPQLPKLPSLKQEQPTYAPNRPII